MATFFKCIFLKENAWIDISQKFLPKGQMNNISALVQMMGWHQPGDKPLSEMMMVILLMHICVTQPQCVRLIHGAFPSSQWNISCLLGQVHGCWYPRPCCKSLSQWECSFHWKLHSHWLKGLWQRHWTLAQWLKGLWQCHITISILDAGTLHHQGIISHVMGRCMSSVRKDFNKMCCCSV